jgi:TonB family protein
VRAGLAPEQGDAHTFKTDLARPTRAHVFSWTASLVVHGVLTAGIGWLAFRTLQAKKAQEELARPAISVVSVQLPEVSQGTLAEDEVAVEEGVVPVYTGGATTPRLDDGRRGHGGTTHATAPATHLSDRNEELTLTPDQVSHLDRDQQQRLHTASDRASWEDRRSTTNPMELTFLASGTGDRAERRQVAEADPSRGAHFADLARVRGGPLGAVEHTLGDENLGEVGAAQLGTKTSSPGLGVQDAHAGRDHRVSADVTHGRPSVVVAAVTIPATDHSRPRDDVDSDQAVAVAVQSIVHASTAGGALGPGSGGTGGGGPAGAGAASGSGSHAPPLGIGEGDWFDLNTTDSRLMPYFRRIHAKVHPLWKDAFPKSAMLDLKQGTVILEFTVERDGTAKVSWPPIRPSGIEEFDRNCAQAIRKASPFEPIPRELGRTRLRIRAPFVAENPIVK